MLRGPHVLSEYSQAERYGMDVIHDSAVDVVETLGFECSDLRVLSPLLKLGGNLQTGLTSYRAFPGIYAAAGIWSH